MMRGCEMEITESCDALRKHLSDIYKWNRGFEKRGELILRTGQSPVNFSSSSLKDSLFLSYSCIVSFTESYSIETLLLNKMRDKVSDGKGRRDASSPFFLSYIKTILS